MQNNSDTLSRGLFLEEYKHSRLRSGNISPMNILVLVAGNNVPSNSATLAKSFSEGMQEHANVSVKTKNVHELKLEHFRLDFYNPEHPEEEDFRELRELMQWADGFVIATPIWNFSVPAHLKNLIDRIGSFALDRETRTKGTLKGKPFYLIFTGGAPTAAWKGLMRFTTGHMTAGLEYFDCTHIGTFFEGKCMKGRGNFGLVVDQRPDVLTKVHRKGLEFVTIVERFEATGKLPLHKRIYRKFYWWGQVIMGKL